MIEIHGGRGKVNIIDSLIKTYDIPNGFEMYIDNKVRLNITKINDYGEVFYVELPEDFVETKGLIHTQPN